MALHGYSHWEHWHLAVREGLLMGHLLRLLRAAPEGAVFADVGHNLGVYTALAAAARPDLAVLSIDPQQGCHSSLRCAVDAAGTAAGRVRLVLAFASGSAGPPRPAPPAGCSTVFAQGHDADNSTAATVPVVGLAAELGSAGGEVAGVKIDVEGGEVPLLRALLPLALDRRIGFAAAELDPSRWSEAERAEVERILQQMLDADYFALTYTSRDDPHSNKACMDMGRGIPRDLRRAPGSIVPCSPGAVHYYTRVKEFGGAENSTLAAWRLTRWLRKAKSNPGRAGRRAEVLLVRRGHRGLPLPRESCLFCDGCVPALGGPWGWGLPRTTALTYKPCVRDGASPGQEGEAEVPSGPPGAPQPAPRTSTV